MLKRNNETFVSKSGLGYCANASIELQKELSKLGIKSKLLYGKYLSENPVGKSAKAHFSKLIENFPSSNDFHGRVKKHFVKNGNKVSDKGGHVVVLADDHVYDVTSAQFGLPIEYSLQRFLDMWDDVHIVEVSLKSQKTSWNQKIQYSYKTKYNKDVAMESYSNAIGCDQPDEDADNRDFLEWFCTQSKEVQSNSKIVSADELGQDYMLHIDKTTPEFFTPMMPRSASPSENNTTARITVAPSLLGCIIGYARLEADFLEGTDKDTIKRTGFKGGYEICKLEFKHCLSPNKQLVFDAENSQEHWLVSYNKQTVDYYPVNVGKMFASGINYTAVNSQEPKVTVDFYLDIKSTKSIKFNNALHLDPGYYKCSITFDRKDNKGSVNGTPYTVTAISGLDYNKAKQLNAAMLSYENPMPKYLNW
jgi:hypothetical protein